jgi:hypothetical protein
MALALLAVILSTLLVLEGVSQKVCPSFALICNLGLMPFPDYVSADLPYYCASGVLRSPTMWLGIFTGGCVNDRTLQFQKN